MTAPEEPAPEHGWGEKLERWRERHSQRGRITRVLWVIIGATVLLAGLAMLVTPGPAFVVIPIGLAMLAMEFAWAERMLDRALVQADKAQQKAREASRRQKIFGATATALGVAAAVTAWMLWEIPLIPG
jgi:uncharacterized protein (TIGR02611 family)